MSIRERHPYRCPFPCSVETKDVETVLDIFPDERLSPLYYTPRTLLHKT